MKIGLFEHMDDSGVPLGQQFDCVARKQRLLPPHFPGNLDYELELREFLVFCQKIAQ